MGHYRNPRQLQPATRGRGTRRLKLPNLPYLVMGTLLLLSHHPHYHYHVVRASSVDSISLNQVFDTVDLNHDHSISREEYQSAIGNWIASTANGDGANSGNNAITGGGNTMGEGGAPPLGMDSNPFSYRKNNAGGSQSNNASNNKSDNDNAGKFDNPALATKNFIKALISSFSAIMATEIGDKTFFIAAVLSMRNDRVAVFGGAICALIIMTILSTMMGLVLPSLMPRKYTHIIGGILFLYFGVKLLLDSRSMEDKVSEELEEVEEELAQMNKKKQIRSKKEKPMSSMDYDDVEGGEELMGGVGGSGDANNNDGSAMKRRGGGGDGKNGVKRAPSSGLSAAGDYSGASWESVFIQALSMTFLAEWGDRSQIATIALAAAKDPLGVTIGGCIGHSICTGMAVVGGRMLASRISEKTVSFYGGLVFLVFGVHSVFFEE